MISIIIPNYNGSRTIGRCLDSVFACSDGNLEVIVVDDCSQDGSVDIIRKFPCRFVQLANHQGASAARNAGALQSAGDVLFFIDADCLLRKETLSRIREDLAAYSSDVVIGGTYTAEPPDPGFFSRFQSVFINYSETKKSSAPDYVATHAMVIHRETFRKAGGFQEHFLPILEDVEFSHRLRRLGYRLIVDPALQVRHIFNFTFWKSLRNAARKTRYWITYSLANKDVFADSGTASSEIKFNGGVWLVTAVLLLLSFLTGALWPLTLLPALWGVCIFVNWRLLKAFFAAGGAFFGIAAGVYYLMVYPAAVWIGASLGIKDYIKGMGKEAR